MKKCVFMSIIFAIMICLSGFAIAGQYPSRAIQVIVPWPAGGGTDMVARAFLKNAKNYLPVNMVIANVIGGKGMIGFSKIAMARPDGYTLGIYEINCQQACYTMGMTKSNALKDITNLSHVAFAEAVIAVRAKSPFKTLNEFVDYIKQNPNKVNMAIGTGKGGAWDVPVKILMTHAKAEPKYIYMQGGPPARTAALGGHVDACSIGIMEAEPFVRSGDLRVLGVFANKRNPFLPDIPTMHEQGFPKIAMGVRWVFAGPKGLKKDRVDILLKFAKACFNDPEFASIITKKVISKPDVFLGPEETLKYMKENGTRIKEALTNLGMAKQ